MDARVKPAHDAGIVEPWDAPASKFTKHHSRRFAWITTARTPMRSAVSWIGRVGRYSPAAGMFLGALDQAEDLKALTAAIKTANDPPATLKQLQENALKPSEPGYQNHHIDEQSLLRSLGYNQSEVGYNQSEVDRPDNVVRTPTLKHYQITGWYARSNPEYGGLSPREYLKSQPESVRRQVGLEVLIRTGVLKP